MINETLITSTIKSAFFISTHMMNGKYETIISFIKHNIKKDFDIVPFHIYKDAGISSGEAIEFHFKLCKEYLAMYIDPQTIQ